MTDENLSIAADEQMTDTNEDISTPDIEQSEEQEAAPSEKMIPQSQVNKIVGLKLQQERDRQARLAKMEQEKSAQQTNSAANTDQNDPLAVLMGHFNQQIKSSVGEAIANLTAQQRDEQAQRDFSQKLESALFEDKDLAGLVQNLGLRPDESGVDAEIVRMTSKLDNMGAVLKELAINPEKYSHLRVFLNDRKSEMAATLLQKISKSISQNDAARTADKLPKPPGQLKPSNLGIGGGKVKGLDDMKSFFS